MLPRSCGDCGRQSYKKGISKKEMALVPEMISVPRSGFIVSSVSGAHCDQETDSDDPSANEVLLSDWSLQDEMGEQNARQRIEQMIG
jgi:hypothetical protein